jgi:hypothetical protein
MAERWRQFSDALEAMMVDEMAVKLAQEFSMAMT